MRGRKRPRRLHDASEVFGRTDVGTPVLLTHLAGELTIDAEDRGRRVETVQGGGDHAATDLGLPPVVDARAGIGPRLDQHAEGFTGQVGASLKEAVEAQQTGGLGIVPVAEGAHPADMRLHDRAKRAPKRRERTERLERGVGIPASATPGRSGWWCAGRTRGASPRADCWEWRASSPANREIDPPAARGGRPAEPANHAAVRPATVAWCPATPARGADWSTTKR